jgi:hypothetical protein
LFGRQRAEGNFRVKGHIATISKHNTPSNTNPKSSFVQEKQNRREFQVQGHCAKVKGHIATIPTHNTPLSPNTSSLQIQIQNLHSFFRRNRTEGNFRFKVTVPRSKVTSPQHTFVL